jgi:hypothetical protein
LDVACFVIILHWAFRFNDFSLAGEGTECELRPRGGVYNVAMEGLFYG